MIDLYRFYNDRDVLLYVGISINAAMRSSQHRAEKDWWGEVARMEVEHIDAPRSEAERLEREAIVRERPLHNVVHNRTVITRPARVIDWQCHICTLPIADGDGYIVLPTSERFRYRREMEEQKQREAVTVGGDGLPMPVVWVDLCNLPKRPRWQVFHRACDPEPADGNAYWFDVKRIRTEAEVITWTAHLMEKRWFAETNWGSFLYEIPSVP